jgi:hypothetical protein
MRLNSFAIQSLAGFAAAVQLHATAPDTGKRLYDFSAVSATNPVVASVKECGIEIPVSEFRGYVDSSHGTVVGQKLEPLSIAEKRRRLDELLDAHLLMWDGYRQHGEATPSVQEALRTTEASELQEALLRQEIGHAPTSPAEYEQAARKLCDQLFEKTDIQAFEDAYRQLKVTVNQLVTNHAPDAGGVSREIRDQPLAQCPFRTVTIGQVLDIYMQLLPTERPDLDNKSAVTAVIKRLLAQDLFVHEARARGLDKSQDVRLAIEKERSHLVWEYAIDQIAGQADAHSRDAGLEARVRRWYEDHLKDHYTSMTDGATNVVSYEKEHETIENDYLAAIQEQLRSEGVKALRQGRTVRIDDRALAAVTILVPVPIPDDLATNVIAWDALTKTAMIRPGETNALFTFALTNVSREAVTIYNVEPACECTTVKTPPLPWLLAPGKGGEIRAQVDLQGHTNSFDRAVDIESSAGPKTLTLRMVFPQ